MADDIVKRLRAAARAGDLPLGVSFDCDAVADEIERLRVDAERADAGVAWLTSKIGHLLAAGDALAHLMPHAHLSVPCRPPQGTPLNEWCSECAALAAWQAARRG